jgi:hypothetical protein
VKPSKEAQKRIQTRILNFFRETCNLTLAAKLAGLDRSNHYKWMREDPAYEAAFEASLVEARDVIKDKAVSNLEAFKPHFHKGKECFALRQRVQVVLADGTTAFQDELTRKQKRVKIMARKTVMTADGPQLGVYKVNTGLISKLLSAWCPEFSRAALPISANEEPPPFVVTIQQR